MRLFHLSDLHIGLRLLNHDLKEDQEYILDQIVSLAVREKPDGIMIAGDIYDKAVPSAEAVEIFDRFISSLHRELPDTAIMMISGNHDSGPRIDYYRTVLADQNIYVAGMAPDKPDQYLQKVTLSDDYGLVHFYLFPFIRPSMVKNVIGTRENGNNFSYEESVARMLDREEMDLSQRNVLVSHQFYLPAGKSPEDMEKDRSDSEIRTVGDIDSVSAGVLDDFDYAALGHIHKPMTAGDPRFIYCGTPLACSVSEAGQNKRIVMVDLLEKADGEKARMEMTILPLEPLHQVRKIKGNLAEILEASCDDYVSVTLTEEGEEETGIYDKIRRAFPRLLEIRREVDRTPVYTMDLPRDQAPDPAKLCRDFLGDMDEESEKLLFDVIRTVQESGEEMMS